MKKRSIPQRMCVGCRQMKPKRELVRIVRDKDGNVDIDLTGRSNGRGAYVCARTECIDTARRKKGLERAFGAGIDPGIYDVVMDKIGRTDD